MTNKIAPSGKLGALNEDKEQDHDNNTSDLFKDGAETSSAKGIPGKLQAFAGSAYDFVIGQHKPRKVALAELQEGRKVTSTAKDLLPALYKVSASPTAPVFIKLFMFIGLNTLLVAMMFVYPRYNTYVYLTGNPQVAAGTVEYKLQNSSFYGLVPLMTDDLWGEQPSVDIVEQLASYDELVALPFTPDGHPGWNLQDILNMTRAIDQQLQYSSPDGARLVQDYQACHSDCLDASGQPKDMVDSGTGLPSRNFTAQPYGQWGDYYVQRSLVLAATDPAYFQQFLNTSLTTSLRSSQANYGFTFGDPGTTADDITINPLAVTVPTDMGYVCTLGRTRKRLEAIQVFTKSCYVKIVSAPGIGYQLFLRTLKGVAITTSVVHTELTNSTTGCQYYTVDITAQAEDCHHPQLIGVDASCELSCAVVIFKGVNARRVPIRVIESPVAGGWPSTLHINDKYLVLDQGSGMSGAVDLHVTGGSIAVNITSARIGQLSVQNTAGVVNLDHVRVDSVFVKSSSDNVIIQDERDTELLYRSAGNLLCATAPLVEAIPNSFLGCAQAAADDYTGEGNIVVSEPHVWYESTQDGYIDRDEFSAGLAGLGLSFGPDSLALDDSQQQQLLDVLFTEHPGVPSDRVTGEEFDANLQAVKDLDFMADTYMLLDPGCYSGRFLKVRPAYNSSIDNATAVIEAASISLLPNSNDTVLDSRMPLYRKASAGPDATIINPCPSDWGSGVQGSTTFSYLRGANADSGFKWGKALPAWCLDEAWPNGGINGKYPNDPAVYGTFAGQSVLPGCEPASCKATYRVVARLGSIHAQVLPYTHDAWNITGSYQTMISNCVDDNGQSHCFYKGWSDDRDASLHLDDLEQWKEKMDPCYADAPECSDTVQAVSILGQGVPMHEKFFWSSRKVYLELEPAWYMVMSATLLRPETNHLQLRLSPGYCAAALGAVEHVDWRRSSMYNSIAGSSAGSGVSHLSAAHASSSITSTLVDPRDALIASIGLRADRNKQIYDHIVSVVNGTGPERAGWFLKQSIRHDYNNESLVFSPITADGHLDTEPGHVDSSGAVHAQGPMFRHRRACVPNRNCRYDYIIYRDNCQVPREAITNDSSPNGEAYMSPCAFTNGSDAWLDPLLLDDSLTFNDTWYKQQFPMQAEQYSVAQRHTLTGDQLVLASWMADANTHAFGHNVTRISYSKWQVQVDSMGRLQYIDAAGAWVADRPLYAAVILSLIIAVLCSLLIVMMLLYAGLGMLNKINQDLQARAKIEMAVFAERKAFMLGEVLEAKRLMVSAARRRAARAGQADNILADKGQAEQPVTTADVFVTPEAFNRFGAISGHATALVIPSGASPAKAGDPQGPIAAAVSDSINADDVFLTEAEKVEIVRVWEEKGFNQSNFRAWDKDILVQAWAEEVEARQLPPGNFTLTIDNVDSKQHNSRLSRLRGWVGGRHVANIAVRDGGPGAPTQAKTLVAVALAADPVKLHKVESRLRHEESMRKLQKQFSSRRGSRETQQLLGKDVDSSGITAIDKASSDSKQAHIQSGPLWQIKGVFLVTAARCTRLGERMVQALMINLPSPFTVINNAVVDLFQGLFLDSLATFLSVKCLFDHEMANGEEILLGQCEAAHKDLKLRGKPVSSSGATTVPPQNNGSGASPHKDWTRADTDAGTIVEPTVIEIDGDADVMACTAVDGRVEMYRVSYVRIMLKSSMLLVPAAPENADSDGEELSEDEGDNVGSHQAEVTVTVKANHGSKPVVWSQQLGKTFAKATSALSGAADSIAHGAGDVLMKRKKVWHVYIDEGPGVITSSKYRPELEPVTTQRRTTEFSGGGAPPGFSAAGAVQNAKLLKRRTICLPCPSRKELQESIVADNAAASVRVRHYLVNTKNGRKVVTINTMPDAAVSTGGILEGGYFAPRVLFSGPLGSFQPDYEKFCMENDLQAKSVLEATAVLSKFNISIKKRVMGKIKGLKQRPANVDSLEEVAGLGEDSCFWPPITGQESNQDDEEDDDEPFGNMSEAKAAGMAALRQGAVPTFPGSGSDSAGGSLGVPGARSNAGNNPSPAWQQQRSTMEGDSDEDEVEVGLAALRLAAQNSCMAIPSISAGGGPSPASGGVLGGVGSRSNNSRRVTGNAPPVTTAAEAAAASKADLRKPAGKLAALLEASQEPLAVFLRDTYDVTGNFVADEVDLEVMQRQFRRWSRAQQGTSTAGAAGESAAAADGAQQAATTGGNCPRTTASLAGATAAAAQQAGLAVPALAATGPPVFCNQPQLLGDDVAAFGFKYQQAPEHTLFGVLVNPQDYSDNPRDANRLVYLGAELVSVLLHTLLIWLLPGPLFVIVFGFQGHYNGSTSIQPMLTLEEFRQHPLANLKLEFYPLLKALVWGSIVWVLFCYIKLLLHYLLSRQEDRAWRALLNTVFWAYLTLMVTVLVAYSFEVFCWVLLGAIINPNKFLPYSVAAVTLVAHARATWDRLMTRFNTYKAALSSKVLDVFGEKIKAAEEATANTESLLQAKLSEAASAADSLRLPAGLAGFMDTGAAMGPGLMAGLFGGAAAAAVAGTRVSRDIKKGPRGALAAARRSNGGDGGEYSGEDSGQEDRSDARLVLRSTSRGLRGQASEDGGDDGIEGVSAHKSQWLRGMMPGQVAGMLPGQVGTRLGMSGAGGALSNSGGRPTSGHAAGGAAAGLRGAVNGAVSNMMVGGGGSGSSGGKKGDALESYSIFKMFAADDDSLDYSEFCALLEHLDIRLLEEKRRKLFARVDKSGDQSIGYAEFQEGFHLLKQQIVERHMAIKGVTIGRLIFLLAYAVLILLLIFVFIFLGVAAFTGANTMGAVVNSCMTAAAGLAMNLKGGDDNNEDEDAEEVDVNDTA